MTCLTVTEINRRAQHDPAAFVQQCEAEYHAKIDDTARRVLALASERPIVLLSGPSGSGKTTSALLVERWLDQSGHQTLTLSLDNYFLSHSAGPLPLDEKGNIDLESPARLDSALLEQQLADIFAGRPVDMPVFDFALQERSGTQPLTRHEGELVIAEGIHALNSAVVGHSIEFSTGMYVSVRTRVMLGGEELHPSRIRLMRRLLRDKLFRGRAFDQTLSIFPSVTRGEDLYIMPHKHRASIELDTFIPYELCVYRDLLLDGLAPDGGPYDELKRELTRFLSALAPIDASLVPPDSLVREFIGGSVLGV